MKDRWLSLDRLGGALPKHALVVIDACLEPLHPGLAAALEASNPRAVVRVAGGEQAKTLKTLETVLEAGRALPRSGTLVAIGGGTVGDLGTVAAHVLKRGVDLVQVPTTVLAAVDSSVGGKGALDLRSSGRVLKNVMGAFHYAKEGLLVPELFESLTPVQRREGAIEAWKMAVCLDAPAWRAWQRKAPELGPLVKRARALKATICKTDPYEQRGVREVLNFGHTFGHVLESLSRFRLSHGDAVGLGMLCALDVGVAMGLTSPAVAEGVEDVLHAQAGVFPRSELAKTLRRATLEEISEILAADKKAGPGGEVRMVLLAFPGRWKLQTVPGKRWQPLVTRWKGGEA